MNLFRDGDNEDPFETENALNPELTVSTEQPVIGGQALPHVDDSQQPIPDESIAVPPIAEDDGIPEEMMALAAMFEEEDGVEADAYASLEVAEPGVGSDELFKVLLDATVAGEGTNEENAASNGYQSSYDISYGYGKYAEDKTIPLSGMTISEVFDRQNKMIAHPENKVSDTDGKIRASGAVGKYQFTGRELKRLTKKHGIGKDEVFSPELQDKLAIELMKERGLDAYLESSRTQEDKDKLLDGMAGTWVSLKKADGSAAVEGQASVTGKEDFMAILKVIDDNPELTKSDDLLARADLPGVNLFRDNINEPFALAPTDEEFNQSRSGIVHETMKSLKSGIINLDKSGVDFLRMVSEEGSSFRTTHDLLSKEMAEELSVLRPNDALEAAIEDSPANIFNPKYLIPLIAGQAPQLAVIVGTAGFGSSIAALGGITNATRVGSAVAGVMGGALESTSTFDQMKGMGYTDAEARSGAQVVGAVTMALNWYVVDKLMSPAGGMEKGISKMLGKGKIGQAAGGFVAGGLNEVMEEELTLASNMAVFEAYDDATNRHVINKDRLVTDIIKTGVAAFGSGGGAKAVTSFMHSPEAEVQAEAVAPTTGEVEQAQEIDPTKGTPIIHPMAEIASQNVAMFPEGQVSPDVVTEKFMEAFLKSEYASIEEMAVIPQTQENYSPDSDKKLEALTPEEKQLVLSVVGAQATGKVDIYSQLEALDHKSQNLVQENVAKIEGQEAFGTPEMVTEVEGQLSSIKETIGKIEKIQGMKKVAQRESQLLNKAKEYAKGKDLNPVDLYTKVRGKDSAYMALTQLKARNKAMGNLFNDQEIQESIDKLATDLELVGIDPQTFEQVGVEGVSDDDLVLSGHSFGLEPTSVPFNAVKTIVNHNKFIDKSLKTIKTDLNTLQTMVENPSYDAKEITEKIAELEAKASSLESSRKVFNEKQLTKDEKVAKRLGIAIKPKGLQEVEVSAPAPVTDEAVVIEKAPAPKAEKKVEVAPKVDPVVEKKATPEPKPVEDVADGKADDGPKVETKPAKDTDADKRDSKVDDKPTKKVEAKKTEETKQEEAPTPTEDVVEEQEIEEPTLTLEDAKTITVDGVTYQRDDKSKKFEMVRSADNRKAMSKAPRVGKRGNPLAKSYTATEIDSIVRRNDRAVEPATSFDETRVTEGNKRSVISDIAPEARNELMLQMLETAGPVTVSQMQEMQKDIESRYVTEKEVGGKTLYEGTGVTSKGKPVSFGWNKMKSALSKGSTFNMKALDDLSTEYRKAKKSFTEGKKGEPSAKAKVSDNFTKFLRDNISPDSDALVSSTFVSDGMVNKFKADYALSDEQAKSFFRSIESEDAYVAVPESGKAKSARKETTTSFKVQDGAPTKAQSFDETSEGVDVQEQFDLAGAEDAEMQTTDTQLTSDPNAISAMSIEDFQAFKEEMVESGEMTEELNTLFDLVEDQKLDIETGVPQFKIINRTASQSDGANFVAATNKLFDKMANVFDFEGKVSMNIGDGYATNVSVGDTDATFNRVFKDNEAGAITFDKDGKAAVSLNENLTDAEALVTLVHETLGHYVAPLVLQNDAKLQQDFVNLLEEDIANDPEYVNDIAKTYDAFDADGNVDFNNTLFMNEYMANMMEATGELVDADGNFDTKMIEENSEHPVVKFYKKIKQLIYKFLSRFKNLETQQEDKRRLLANDILKSMYKNRAKFGGDSKILGTLNAVQFKKAPISDEAMATREFNAKELDDSAKKFLEEDLEQIEKASSLEEFDGVIREGATKGKNLLTQTVSGIKSQTLNAESAIDVAGFNEDSEIYKKNIENMEVASDKQARLMKDFMGKMEQTLKNAGVDHIDSWTRLGKNLLGKPRRSTLMFIDGKKFAPQRIHTQFQNTELGGKTYELTRGERVSLALHSLSPKNRQHLTTKGFTLAGDTNNPVVLSNADLDGMMDQLTDQERGVADGVTDWLNNEQRQAIEETMGTLGSESLDMVEMYFPILADKNALGDSKYIGMIDGENVSLETMQTAFDRKGDSRSGNLKNRSEATAQIVLEDVFSAAVRTSDLVAKFYGFAKPVHDAKAFNRRIKKSLDNNNLGWLNKSMEDRIERLDGRQRTDFEKWYLQMSGMYTVGKLGGRVFTTVKQLGSTATAATEFSETTGARKAFGSLIKNIGTGLFNTAQAETEIGEYSPQLDRRFHGMISRDIGETMHKTEARRLLSSSRSLSDIAMAPISKFDKAVIISIWETVKSEANAKTDLEVNSPEYWAYVKNRSETVVRRTQPTYDQKDRSALSANPMAKPFMMFSSVRMKNFQMLARAIAEIKRGDVKSGMTKLALVGIVTSATMAALDDLRDKAKGKDTEGTFIRDSIVSFASNVPLVGNAVDKMLTGYGDATIVPLEAMEDLLVPLQELLTDGKTLEELLDDGLKAASNIGIPTGIIQDMKSFAKR